MKNVDQGWTNALNTLSVVGMVNVFRGLDDATAIEIVLEEKTNLDAEVAKVSDFQ